MSRKFSFTVPYTVPVEDLHRALTDDKVWQARFADAETATLDLSHPEGADSIRIHMTEKAAQDKVPSVVSKVLKSELMLSRTDHWQALDGDVAKGTFEGSTGGISTEMSGTYEMRSTAEGSEIEVVGTVQVHVPLVGGAIEPLAEQLHHRVLNSERKFIEEWVAAQATA
ncbi:MULTISPECIES: DUF2505 domain-containing protein [Nocardia]|uniref:DUF2505 domain-containing protein n=2 Tax=Nocardia TaxID=1817 RepID=K0F0A9_NOCB7|nr:MULTISPECIES: DUF2505 domain-containing protein [Nocardia]AFU05663.1 hypothetical protein O3I_038580 [Nocardia brasiliensis ATCC 700358]ASF11382.1 DUF2505 domain-containing protein [Nocardia brasiliensis]KIA62707.1 hypothetical protein FG87_23780 [Nocardia vulneris]MBF6131267.1 DUF2505 domain-containing protein [Nocardia brasiliensis]MBF6546017.1 DUF2505 domain-containing protein [Nocardia brasiliensis]